VYVCIHMHMEHMYKFLGSDHWKHQEYPNTHEYASYPDLGHIGEMA
jgi:hypothetical protein